MLGYTAIRLPGFISNPQHAEGYGQQDVFYGNTMNSKSTSMICALVLTSLFFMLYDATRKAQAHNMAVSKAYENLRLLVTEIAADIEEAEKGNEAAEIRVRDKMQEIKLAAHEVQLSTIEIWHKPAENIKHISN